MKTIVTIFAATLIAMAANTAMAKPVVSCLKPVVKEQSGKFSAVPEDVSWKVRSGAVEGKSGDQIYCDAFTAGDIYTATMWTGKKTLTVSGSIKQADIDAGVTNVIMYNGEKVAPKPRKPNTDK